MSFDLESVNLTYDIVKDLPMAKNLNLKALTISSFSSFIFVCDGCSRKWSQLFQKFVANQTELREFSFDCCITDKLLKTMAETCPKLEYLLVRMYKDSSFNFGVFSQMENLSTLILKLGSEKKKAVSASAFKHFIMPNLKMFKISGLKLDKQGTDLIKKNNPNLEYFMEAI